MSKELEFAVIDLKKYIENTAEYCKVLKLKEQMEKSSKIQELIKEIKKVQKEYIRSGEDENHRKTLKNLEKKLYEIPIYGEYVRALEKINDMIFVVKEELNEYFYEKINI